MELLLILAGVVVFVVGLCFGSVIEQGYDRAYRYSAPPVVAVEQAMPAVVSHAERGAAPSPVVVNVHLSTPVQTWPRVVDAQIVPALETGQL